MLDQTVSAQPSVLPKRWKKLRLSGSDSKAATFHQVPPEALAADLDRLPCPPLSSKRLDALPHATPVPFTMEDVSKRRRISRKRSPGAALVPPSHAIDKRGFESKRGRIAVKSPPSRACDVPPPPSLGPIQPMPRTLHEHSMSILQNCTATCSWMTSPVILRQKQPMGGGSIPPESP